MLNIQSDSRKIKSGDTFIAIKCEINDGHRYIQNAVLNGATKIIAERVGDYGVETQIVEDTRKYLNTYLEEQYNPFLEKMNIIGITGTNGKTTTAVLLHDALNLLGQKTAYIGTNGFYIKEKISNLPNTTVDTCDIYDLFMRAYDAGCKNIVMEVSSHGLESGKCDPLQFDYAIFTNLTQDHLDEHGTMQNYAKAKQKLFKHLRTNGKAIINSDDSYTQYFKLKENHNITFGFQKADYSITSFQMSSEKTTFTYQNKQNNYSLETFLLGRYNIYNVLGVIACLSEMNISTYEIGAVIPKLKSPVGRLETIPYKTNSIIIDYAHTPDALSNIFHTVKEFQKGNIYAVFGCTGNRDRTKRPLMTNIVASNTNYFIITNDDPHFEDTNQIVNDMIEKLEYNHYEVCLDRKLAIQRGIDLLKKNDTLLILGKGHEEIMIIKNQNIPFNDKKEVLAYLQEKM